MTATAPVADVRQRLIGFLLVFIAAVSFSIKAILAKLSYHYPVDAEAGEAFRQIYPDIVEVARAAR